MKSKIRYHSNLFCAAVFLTFGTPLAHAGTVSTTFSVQQGNLLQDGNPYGSGTGYAGVVDGVITDSSATFARTTTGTATIGNQFRTGSPNGQQLCGLFSYDLTELNTFIAANTGPFSSVAIQSVSFQLVSNGSNSGGAMALNLFGTDPFTSSGCTWANYTTGTPWTIPYQNIASTVAYGFTGGPSALTPSLGATNPSTTVTSGNALTWTSSANFISAVSAAFARPDKTLFLAARGSFFNNGDNRLSVNFSSTATVASRPKLVVTLDVTSTAAPATWTGATSDSWTTATNWTPGSVPATDAPIIFDSSSTANLNTLLNQDFTVTSVTVSSPSGAVSVGGANNLNLGAGGFDLTAATQDLTVSAPVVLGATQSWNVGSGRTLGVNGVISGNFPLTIAGAGKVSLGASNILPNGATAGNLAMNGTLDINGTSQSLNGLNGSGTVDNTAVGSATLTVGNNDAASAFSGIIQDTSGALAIVKTGSGQLTLTGANDYSGGFTNNGSGNVVPGHDNAFGTGPVVSNAGTIYPTTKRTFANSLTLNGSTLRIGGGNSNFINWNGAVTATGTVSIMCDGGTAGITLGNTLDISGATINSSANGTTNNIVGNITGAGGNLNVTAGTLQLSGANNTYGGTTTISTGCFLRLDATGTLPASGNVVINGGGLTIRNTAGWTLNGTISGDGLGAINLNTGANVTLAGGISGVASINTSISATNVTISGAISGAANINVQTAGATLTLSGANGYTGTTNVTAGTLALGASNTLPDGSAITIGSGTLDADTFTDSAGTLDPAAAAVINLGAGGALAFADSSAVDWTGGTLDITGTFIAGSSIRFGTSNSGLTSTQVAQISVNGSGAGTYALDSQGFLVTAPGYSAWKTANGTTQDINLDHDGDGVSNGIEYFLVGPNASAGFTALPPVMSNLGTLSVTWTKAASYVGVYNTDFVVETSDTLIGAWTSEALGVNVTVTGNDVKYTFPGGTKKFARLKVTGP